MINRVKYLKNLTILILLTLFLIMPAITFQNKYKKTTQTTSKENESISNQINIYHNKDIKAIFTINNTKINIPITQAKTNNYYKKHNLFKEEDSSGTPYLDSRVTLTNSRKIIIYIPTPTEISKELENYQDETYYKNHKYLTLTTNDSIKYYLIFSVYIETNDFSYQNLTQNTIGSWLKHLTTLKNKSLYNTKVDITTQNEILIVQAPITNINYSSYQKKYLLIIAKSTKSP